MNPEPIANYPFISDKSHIYRHLEQDKINKVNFGWKSFSLSLVPNLLDESIKCDGLTNYDDGTIALEINLADERARETLLHECLHCVLKVTGLDHENEKITVDNEDLTIRLTTGLLLFKNLNPKLSKILLGA
jgi:hypothetical protein